MLKKCIIILCLLCVFILPSKVSAALVGSELPDIQLTDLAGNPVTIADFQGQFTLFDVWATWCSPCIGALEEYKKNYQRFMEVGVQVVAISIDARLDTVIKHQKKAKYPFTVLHDNSQMVMKTWNIKGIPTFFLVDPQGNILMSQTGKSDFNVFFDRMIITMNTSNLKRVNRLVSGNYKTEMELIPYQSLILDQNLNFERPYFPIEENKDLEFKEPKHTDDAHYISTAINDMAIHTLILEKKWQDSPQMAYIDYNQNLDFTDDGEPITVQEESYDSNTRYTFDFEIKVPVLDQVTMPYKTTVIYADNLGYYQVRPTHGLRASILTDSDKIEVFVIDITGDGTLDTCFLDLNQNGIFDSYMGEEWFQLGREFVVNGVTYNIHLLDDGSITIRIQ